MKQLIEDAKTQPHTYAIYLVDKFGRGPTPNTYSLLAHYLHVYAHGKGEDTTWLATMVDGVMKRPNWDFEHTRKDEGMFFVHKDSDNFVPARKHRVDELSAGISRIVASAPLKFAPLSFAPCDVNYARCAATRINNKINHKQSTPLLDLFDSVCKVIRLEDELHLEGYLIYGNWSAPQAHINEIIITELAQANHYTDTGFVSTPPGDSNNSAWKLLAEDYRSFSVQASESIELASAEIESASRTFGTKTWARHLAAAELYTRGNNEFEDNFYRHVHGERRNEDEKFAEMERSSEHAVQLSISSPSSQGWLLSSNQHTTIHRPGSLFAAMITPGISSPSSQG